MDFCLSQLNQPIIDGKGDSYKFKLVATLKKKGTLLNSPIFGNTQDYVQYICYGFGNKENEELDMKVVNYIRDIFLAEEKGSNLQSLVSNTLVVQVKNLHGKRQTTEQYMKDNPSVGESII